MQHHIARAEEHKPENRFILLVTVVQRDIWAMPRLHARVAHAVHATFARHIVRRSN